MRFNKTLTIGLFLALMSFSFAEDTNAEGELLHLKEGATNTEVQNKKEIPPISVYFGPAAADDPNGNFYNLLRFIDSAEHSLYCAFHELDLIKVAEALAKKKEEGVYVEVLLEEQYLDGPENKETLRILEEAKIKYRADYNSATMHNKYIIADKKRVWTGGANLTEHGYFFHYNDSLWIESEDVAKKFLRDYLSLINPQRAHGGSLFKKYTYHAGEIPIDIYFSPKDRPTRFLEKEINEAKSTIDFAIFVFSHQGMTMAMKWRDREGVRIRGILDNGFAVVTWPFVPFQVLKKETSANIKFDDEEAKVHHKFMLIDDNTVVTGSLNFSKNAESKNNENVMVIRSSNISKLYKDRYNYLWKRFPNQSLYEEFLTIYSQTSGKNNVVSSEDLEENEEFNALYSEFKSSYWKEQAKALGKIRKTGTFEGIMRDAVDGGIINVEMEGFDRYLTVRLAGVVPPANKTRYTSQQPQATYALQFVSLTANQKPVRVEITEENGFGTYTAIVYHSYFTENGETEFSDVSLNEMVLQEGFGFPTEVKGTNDTHKEIIKKAYLYGKNMKKGIWSEELRLRQTPWDFLEYAEKRSLRSAERIAKFTIGEYEPGCVIGKKTTRKYYTEDSVYYEGMLSKVDDHEKLLFFASEEDAKRAGYKKTSR